MLTTNFQHFFSNFNTHNINKQNIKSMQGRLIYNVPQTQSGTCESDQEPEQHEKQFKTMNNIYELQSVINKLSLEKQKNYLAYTIAVKQQKYIVEGYQEIVSQLKTKLQEAERHLKEERSRGQYVQAQKKKLQIDKKKLQDKFNEVVQTDNGNIPINLMIINYIQMRNQLQTKTQQIKSLQQQQLQKTNQNTQLRHELQRTKKNMSSQYMSLTKKLHEQSLQFNTKFNTLNIEFQTYNLEQQKKQNQLQQNIMELQQQNKMLMKKIADYRSQVQQLKNVYIDNQLLKLQVNCNKMDSVYMQKYKQIRSQYQQVLGNSITYEQEIKRKQRQISIARQQVNKYMQEAEDIRSQLLLTKQINDKLNCSIKDFQIQVMKPNKEAIGNLAKLQQLSFNFQRQRNKLQIQLNQSKKSNMNLHKKLQQKEQKIVFLQKLSQNQKQLIQKLRNSNASISQKLSCSIIQQNHLKIRLQQAELQIKRQKLLVLKKEQMQQNKDISLKQVRMSTQKYEAFMTNLISAGKQKSILSKELEKIKEQVKLLNQNIKEKMRENSESKLQIDQLKSVVNKLSAQRDQLCQRVQKLQSRIEKKVRENNEDHKQFVSKTQLMQQCLSRTQRQKQQLQATIKRLQKRRNNMQMIAQSVQLNIQPQKRPQFEKIKYTKLASDQKSIQSNKVQRMRIKSQITNINMKTLHIDNIKYEENKSNQDSILQKKIKQLKNKNKNLSQNLSQNKV